MAFLSTNSTRRVLNQRTRARLIIDTFVEWVNGENVVKQMPVVFEKKYPASLDSFDFITPDLIADRDIYVVDKHSGDLFRKVKRVAAMAQSVIPTDHLDAAILLSLHKMQSKFLIVINIDTFEHLDDAVDHLLAIKPLLKEVAFVICSTSFAVNDFSLHRRAIADASLRLPCSDVSLALAIESGIQNNMLRPS